MATVQILTLKLWLGQVNSNAIVNFCLIIDVHSPLCMQHNLQVDNQHSSYNSIAQIHQLVLALGCQQKCHMYKPVGHCLGQGP